jgi:hypothetical protein
MRSSRGEREREPPPGSSLRMDITSLQPSSLRGDIRLALCPTPVLCDPLLDGPARHQPAQACHRRLLSLPPPPPASHHEHVHPRTHTHPHAPTPTHTHPHPRTHTHPPHTHRNPSPPRAFQLTPLRPRRPLLVVVCSLTEDQKDFLVKGFTSLGVERGEVVIQQGEAGDHFYIADSGKYCVRAHRHVSPPLPPTTLIPRA